jgi:Tfp pilus assembly protein PilV
MGQTVMRNKGFTLVEMMISIVIIMISLLALLTMMLKTIDANTSNEMRSAAVRLTNLTAEALLAIPTPKDIAPDPLVTAGTYTRIPNDLHQDNCGLPEVQQSIRGARKTFDIGWTVVDTSNSVKQISIAVSYDYKGQGFNNSTVIYKHSTGM